MAQAEADTLRKLPALTTLRMGGFNECAPAERESLLKVLRELKTLTFLWLPGHEDPGGELQAALPGCKLDFAVYY